MDKNILQLFEITDPDLLIEDEYLQDGTHYIVNNISPITVRNVAAVWNPKDFILVRSKTLYYRESVR